MPAARIESVAKDGAIQTAQPASGQPPQLLSAWRAYHSVVADWRKGGRFEKQFPQQPYRHSLPEESEALAAAARVLQALRQDSNSAELVAGNTVAGLLLKLHEAGLIDPYVLFSLGDDGIARDYKAYRAANRTKLEEYMDKFVMPPAPAQERNRPSRRTPPQSLHLRQSRRCGVAVHRRSAFPVPFV